MGVQPLELNVNACGEKVTDMKPEELFAALKAIADACAESKPAVASVLYTLCGCLAFRDDDTLLKISKFTTAESEAMLRLHNEQTMGNMRLS